MANAALRLPDNVDGDFFVDSTCIDCDACRIFAPSVFRDANGQSAVYQQPANVEELLAAQRALVTCPTSSIGTLAHHDVKPALATLPERIDDDVHRCGFAAESSFGAISYYIKDVRVLIDSPRFAGPLVHNLTAAGGVRRLLLTHQDDVADHAKFHERFGCERVLHRADVHSGTAMVETQPDGVDPIDLGDGFVMIPTPGHTRGHAVFLLRDKFLFTGDHLAWSERRGHLYAFRDACWYSWSEQIRSMERLADFNFEWVLPGHGRPVRLTHGTSRDEIRKCVDWMKNR